MSLSSCEELVLDVGGPQLGGSFCCGLDKESKKLSLSHPLPLNGVLARDVIRMKQLEAVRGSSNPRAHVIIASCSCGTNCKKNAETSPDDVHSNSISIQRIQVLDLERLNKGIATKRMIWKYGCNIM